MTPSFGTVRILLTGAATVALGACFPTAAGEVSIPSARVAQLACRPEGLHQTTGVDVPYCSVYGPDGREAMGPRRPRRVVGYFTAWRTGSDGQPAYLVPDIPWDRVTHLNYAFAHIDGENRLSIGDPGDPGNPATGMEWPGVPGAEMDAALPYRGHFNLLTRHKRSHPHVKTLISVGGWGETGGYVSGGGERVASGGFYGMTTRPDGSVNREGIDAFARSAVEFLRRYGFDGLDVDYEYPTSMAHAGNPLDAQHAEPLRPFLVSSYVELMRSLREALDRAAAEDGRHYLLTAAAPASAYLLRGMESFQAARYLDYVNIMAYDLHGTWNDHVGHQAPLFDTGRDSELLAWDFYDTPEYAGIGYLNGDWAYRYFRGSLPPGRINLGIPAYTRGWRGVTGGRSGLWGRAPLPDQSRCPPGTAIGESRCGHGAVGIDNLWRELEEAGSDLGGGSNPMWHAKNLERGILPSYLGAFGLDPAGAEQDRLRGRYVRRYDDVAKAPWLWNEDKDVFLSIEDEESLTAKVRYVIAHGLGGVMLWELAGDYAWHPERNGGRGEFYTGSTLTALAHELMSDASPYETRLSPRPAPRAALDVTVQVTGFETGDANYPISPTLRITNRTGVELPGGTELGFDLPTSTPPQITGPEGTRLRVVESAHASPGNVGGLKGDFHRIAFSLPPCEPLGPGETYEMEIVYYLPASGPSNYAITVGGSTFALAFEHPELPRADPPAPPASARERCEGR